MLVNRELYFAAPKELNDPYDCRISIVGALDAALKLAEQLTSKDIGAKLERLYGINHIFKKIEQDVQSTGIFSLSRLNRNILMWSHYADEHRGFCLGFRLSKNFTEWNRQNRIVACDDVKYVTKNPFVDYFINFAKENISPDWDSFWPPLIQIGLQSKSRHWRYEKEVRVIRKEPGSVPFAPAELVEVIFGLDMNDEHQHTIRNLLAGQEWKHVRFKKINKRSHDFKISLENLKAI